MGLRLHINVGIIMTLCMSVDWLWERGCWIGYSLDLCNRFSV